ncbi:unnamed protein product [Periconia digitata]|uniref:Myb-like domain-containing protein n=1 Tax=Periconia digitata TaxID=1303443 RepID=A0A9W4UHQ4_9PLEO|nr:unnamed protein product [Periconia digitata]
MSLFLFRPLISACRGSFGFSSSLSSDAPRSVRYDGYSKPACSDATRLLHLTHCSLQAQAQAKAQPYSEVRWLPSRAKTGAMIPCGRSVRARVLCPRPNRYRKRVSDMPKVDKTSASHQRNSSISAASAVGAGTRSSSWSTKDDETLIQARASGLNWNQIAPKHFPAKSPNACRKRHERLMEKQHTEQWDGPKLEILATTYMDHRAEIWGPLANLLGEKWATVEQKCMEKGLKNLNQVYRSAQKKAHDSGISISDDDDHLSGLSYPQYRNYAQQPKRVNSIQSILQQPAMAYAHQQY